jgi:photosystem II stability/assembly factor-like uncharacterized protein
MVVSALLLTVQVLTGSGDDARVATAQAAPQVDPSFLNALEWRHLGPFRGGRTSAVAGDAKTPLVFYFGSAHGGVWKTTDAGIHWRNVSDGFFKKSAVGAIDVSLSDPSVVFVGMGEAITRQDIVPGDGVYKSTDGGATWTHVGLKETRHIAKIRIHPTNPDIVYVAAVGDIFGTNPERGIYRTVDGGKTWKQVLFKSERAAAADLVMDPTNPKVLFASLNQLQRLMWDEISGGPDTGLYKTVDGGDTWTDITRNPGMPPGVLGKIGLALSPAKPDRIWALVEAEDGALLRSDDGGKTWARLNERRDLRRWSASYMHIVADTINPDLVWIPSYDLWKSLDGGKTFEEVPTPHGDNHALWIDPKNPLRMIEGNDGGATVTLDGGITWSSIHNQPTADLFSLAIDDQVPYRVYAAQNDNTHIAIPSRTSSGAIAFVDNEVIPGGEGGETAVKPDGSVVYAADRTAINRYDRRTGQAPVISVWPDDQFTMPVKDVKNRFYYTSPLLLSPHDPNVLYAAGNRVFRTTDEGFTWEPISPDITQNRQDKMQQIPGRPITSMWSSLYWVSVAQSLAESPVQKGEIWVGTDDGTVHVTKDGGTKWANVSPKGLPEWTTIAAIEVSHHEKGTAYLAAHRYRVSDVAPYFFKTTDYGATWEKITNGIPAEDFARVIREDPVRPGLLYAGTQSGVHVSFNGGRSWQSLQRNLPVVAAQYMRVKDDDLVVATHGRGFWIMDNLTSLRQITPDVTASAAHLFQPAPTDRYSPVMILSPRRQPSDVIQFARSGDIVTYVDRRERDGKVRRHFFNAGQNPQGGVIIDYFLKHGQAAMLTIADASGKTIKEYTSTATDARWMPAAAGMNRFAWDMRYPGPRELTPPPGLYGAEFPRGAAPLAVPGRYVVKLTVGSETQERQFEIRRDPRLTATDDDLRAQFDLITRIGAKITSVTEAVERLRKARTGIEERPSGDRAQLLARLLTIEGRLTRLVGRNQVMLPPLALNNRLAALASEVNQGDAKPTRAMQAVFDELSALVDAQIRELDEVLKPASTARPSGGR